MKLTSKDNSLYIDFEFKLRNLSLIIIESAHWCWKTHQTPGKKIVNIKSIIILTLFQYTFDENKHINDMNISFNIQYIETKWYTKLNRLILNSVIKKCFVHVFPLLIIVSIIYIFWLVEHWFSEISITWMPETYESFYNINQALTKLILSYV